MTMLSKIYGIPEIAKFAQMLDDNESPIIALDQEIRV